MPLIEVPSFRMYTTSSNVGGVSPLDVTEALNMVWTSSRLRTRNGSSLFKNNDQANWGRPEKKISFSKRGDTFYYFVVVFSSGRVFYIRSDDVNFATASATWTELNSSSSSTPALAVGASQYDIFGFNNRLYFADSTNGYFSWNGTDADLTAETNPPNLASNNIIKFKDKSNRLLALDDGGLTHLSAINDGQDFTAVSGGGVLNYGRVEGLVATNVAPFQDDIIITTENRVTRQFQAYQLTGIQFFDPAVTGTDTSQFEVRKINSIGGIIGRSAQEIFGDTIGLSPRGFVSLSKAIQLQELSERDFISSPIKELIPRINFANADKIFAAVDSAKGRYYCAVPFGEDTEEANVIFVYDFLRSSPSEGIYRWTLWNFAPIDSISTIEIIAGDLYVSDINGNIYKVDDSNAGNADDDRDGVDNAISYKLRTAGFGGQNPGLEKDFGIISSLLTDLTADYDLTVTPIINNVRLLEDINGEPIKNIRIELPAGTLLYDTGYEYDDFLLYDSGGSDQRVVTFSNKGGRANFLQLEFSTNTTGVSWGIANMSIGVDGLEETNESGVNNSGDI